MDNRFAETLKAAKELKCLFKCLHCDVIPFEPYFTGVCDHLLCKKCITKSNSCPICKAGFYQKELHVNKMIKEAILYASSIIDLVDDSNKPVNNGDDSLPDIDITFDEKSSTKDTAALNMAALTESRIIVPDTNAIFRVPDLPKVKETLESQLKPTTTTTTTTRSRANNKAASQTQSNTQKANNRRGKKKQSENLPLIAENNQFENQSQNTSQNSTQGATRRSARKNNKGETPLHLAVMKKDMNAIKELLNDPSTDVNAMDYAGWTPLHEAVGERGHIESIKLLLSAGADVNAKGYQKNTPLHEAALNLKYEFIEYLLSHSAANANARNEFGITPKDLVKTEPKFVALFEKYSHQDVINESQTQALQQSQIIDLDTTNGHLMGADQLNISSTYRSRSRGGAKSGAAKRLLLFGTGMNEAEKQRLNQLAAKLRLQVAKEMNNNVTHVVFSGGKTCNRTLNYMKAILMGIWIVNIKWLEDSISKGVIQEENDYEAEGSTKMPKSNGPFNGRKNASCQYPKLFEDCSIFLHGDFNAFEKPEMTQLVQMSGAKILKREPKIERIDEFITPEDDMPQHLDRKFDSSFSCSTFVLYETSFIKEVKHKYLFTVRPGWLFACIDQFKILHPDDPILKA